MYQSSEAFGNWIQQDSRTFQARLTLEGKTITEGILSIRLNGGSNSEDDFSLGSAVSRYVELEIEKTGTRFEGYEFFLELGLNGEYIPMGYFTAEKPKGDEERLSITAYDRMVKTERACFLELPDTTNTVAVLKGVGTITGVEVVTEGLTAIPMKKPVGYTCREVLSYVAQLYGGFAICNRAGKIEIKSYEDNGYTVTAGRYWDSFTHNDLPFVLGKIICYTGKDKEGEDISIHVGDGVRGIYFSNPFMDQTALDNIWGKLKDYTYMPGSFRFLGDPRIDPWDVLTVKDRNENSYKVPAMKLTQEYDGGLSTEVEAVGKTEAEQSTGFTGPNTQNLDRLYAQLVLIDHAMINKLDVDTAKITYATIDNLNALKAEIEQLDVTELTARVAKIEKAYITDAEVKNLLAGYATIGNLNATNAQITSLSGKFAAFEKTTTEELVAAKGWLLEGSIGDAQISKVSANKLTAGTIDTAIITVAGSDGHLKISDNTIQIKDLQRVRVQIGKDASGEYSLSVWDKAGKLIWDALGATEDTIQRKIIRDKMVADDAAINALKLDLKSLNTALTEQGVTISGTVVQVGNKTLNVELTEQKQLTTEHGETLTDHAARITANENAIKLKVSTQEYESYKTTVNGEIATAKNRLNAAESSINVMKDQIALKVEQTDIEEAVNNIQIGARNLYPNSKGDFVIKPRNTGASSDNYNSYKFDVDMSVGETYTIGADIEITHGSFNKLTIFPYPGGKQTEVDIPSNKRVVYTFTKKAEETESILVYAGIAGETRGNGMIIRKVKIEVGNKATAWSPALEDIEADIAEVDGKFVNYSTTVQMNAAITAAKDSITSTVSKTYATKTEVSSVSGKVTSLESWKQEASQKITKDGILSTVGDYYATSKYVETVENGVKENEKYIASVETLANQTSNKFLWIVKSGTSATNFELTDRTATLVANAINLKGLVTFTGLNSDTQGKINSAQNTANTAKNTAEAAKSTANTAKSTADAVTSTVNANKANWDKGYNWTNTNGSNMSKMLDMVKTWTDGALSTTTTINGGYIKTNTINASHLTLGDFTNLVDVNESLPQSAVPDDTHHFGANARPVCKDGYWSKKGAAYDFLALASYKPNSFADGDELYYEFTAHSASVGNYYIGLWFYDGESKKFQTTISGNNEQVTTSDKTFSGIIKLKNVREYDFYTIGICDNNSTKKQIYVKNISVFKRSKGNLIVDGAITTNKLAAQAVTAAKINVKDLFAQDITATGTIRGVTLRGSKGEIGGFEINSTRLYSVDSSGTYAAYFSSYDFNKTNAFVAQTKVGGTWVNTAEIRYDGSIILRAKHDTRVRTTMEAGGIACTGIVDFGKASGSHLIIAPAYELSDGTNDPPEESFSICSQKFEVTSSAVKVRRLSTYTSGGHLVFASDGATLAYSASSSIRYKDHIRDMSVPDLEGLWNLPVVWYKYKDGYLASDDKMVGKAIPGFYAEQVECYLPSAARYNTEGKIEDWNERMMIPYMTKGIQQLHKETKYLESETVSLRAQVSSLQYQLQQAFNQLAIQTEQIKKLQAEG